MACEVLVPWPGIELASSALQVWSLNHWTARVLVVVFHYYLLFDPAQLLHLHFLICKIEIIMPVSMGLSRLNEVVLRELPVQDRAHSRGSISFPGFEEPSLTPLLSRVLGVFPLTPAGGSFNWWEHLPPSLQAPEARALVFIPWGVFVYYPGPCTLRNLEK